MSIPPSSEKSLEPEPERKVEASKEVTDENLTHSTPPQESSGHGQQAIARSFLQTALSFLIKQWLICGLAIGCLLAFFFPNVGARGGVLKAQYTILYGAVGLIFLISGFQIPREKLLRHVGNWRLHIITQAMSFLIIPAIQLAIVWTIIAGGGLSRGSIDVSMLVGMIVVACIPTTIASNVVMTRAAGGDDAAAMVEVMIGNVLGTFISPSLISAMLPNTAEFDGWHPSQASGLSQLYANVFKQLGLSVLLPLFVGQVSQWFFPEQVKWVVARLYLAKLASLCMVLLVWSTFSSCFASGALSLATHTSIICNVFVNVGIYLVFTVICFFLARPPSLLFKLEPLPIRFLPKRLEEKRLFRKMSRQETIAICFCGAAKTTSLGIPLVTAMWAQSSELQQSSIQIPVVLYTTEQIFLAQIIVYGFKRWVARAERRTLARVESDAETVTEV